MSERGQYRSVSTSLISGKDFRKLPERARWVFVVLKMNTGMAGIETWYHDEMVARVSSETGASAMQVCAAFNTLENAGWIKREDNVLWLVDHLTYDPHALVTNSKHRKSVQRHVAGMPHMAIVRAFIEHHAGWFPVAECEAAGIRLDSYPITESISEPNRVSDKEPIPKKAFSKIAGSTVTNNQIPITGTDTQTQETKPSDSCKSPDTSDDDDRSPKPSVAFPSEDFKQLYDAWFRLGRAVNAGRFRKALAPLFPTSGRLCSVADLIAGMEAFSEYTATLPPDKARWETIEVFAGDVGRWVRLGSQPAVDPVTHELTERGRTGLRDKLI